MKIAILGLGAYGIALARVFNYNSNKVYMWSKFKEEVDTVLLKRENMRVLKDVKIPKEVVITSNLKETIQRAKIIVIATPTSAVREVAKSISEYLTEEQAMLQTLEDLGKEPGFNIIQFIEQQEQAQGKSFSLEEKNKIIQQYGKMTQGEQNNDIRNRVKVNPVDLKSEKATAKPEVQQKENTSKAGREPGDE